MNSEEGFEREMIDTQFLFPYKKGHQVIQSLIVGEDLTSSRGVSALWSASTAPINVEDGGLDFDRMLSSGCRNAKSGRQHLQRILLFVFAGGMR